MDLITEYIKNTWRNRPEKCRLTLTDVLTGVVSGLVVGLLLFVFACVFAELIFGAHPELAKSLDIGVLEQTLTVLVGSLLTVMMSGNPVAIAGPDITTALFMTSAAKQVAIAIVAMPDVDNAAVLPTVLVMIALVTVVIGVLWIVMGYYSITRALEYMPAPILAGFVASIGYKVLCKAVDTATGSKRWTFVAPETCSTRSTSLPVNIQSSPTLDNDSSTVYFGVGCAFAGPAHPESLPLYAVWTGDRVGALMGNE
jgi:hypothetical protein